MKWAKSNVGATVPESAGIFFSWGNTNGHPYGAGYNFSQDVYNETPAANIESDLSLNEDAARAYLGTPWRMPTSTEFRELFDNCSHEWTTLNGVNGYLFTSNANGNTLFFPAPGLGTETNFSERGYRGDYWSSTYDNNTNARRMIFNNQSSNPQNSGERRYGCTVRAVKSGTPNRSIIPPTPEDEPKNEETTTVEEPKDSNER